MRVKAFELLAKVRSQKPLVHHITNWVTIYDCAQIVKCLGGSPVMAHAAEEVADMTGIAASLVLNIGTLTTSLVEAMKTAALAANRKGIPVVLDACGAGATPLRDRKIAELLEAAHMSVIKGNASEIARVAGLEVRTRGVDAAEVNADLNKLAQDLAKARNAVVVVTGKEDLVTDGTRTYRVRNGHEWMSAVVGTGCMAASVIGAFAGVESDLVEASTCALGTYGVAAELAAEAATGPAMFKTRLLDCFYSLDEETVRKRLQTEPVLF